MNSRRVCTLLNLVVSVVICVAILMSHNQNGVEASRVLSEDFGSANHLQTYTSSSSSSSAYEQAKITMTFWLQRLASGPSPKGRGHWFVIFHFSTMQVVLSFFSLFFFFFHFFGCWGQDPLYTDIYKERCGASISKYPHVYIFEIRFFDLYIILISLPDSSYMLLCPILPSVTQTACDDVKSPTTLFWKYAILVEINLLFFYY